MANDFKGCSQNDARAPQKTPRFDIAPAGGTSEQNVTFPDGDMQIEPAATEFPDFIEGGSQIDTNRISGAHWPAALDGVSQMNTSSEEWLQSSIDINGAALSESAPRLPLIGSTTSDQTNTQTGDFHNELYTLFDHNYSSFALPNAMLWSLFPSENQP